MNGMLIGEGQHGVSWLATLEKSNSGQVEALCGPPTEVYKGNLARLGKDEFLFVELIKRAEPSARHLFEELSEEWMDLDADRQEELKFLLIDDWGRRGYWSAYAEG